MDMDLDMDLDMDHLGRELDTDVDMDPDVDLDLGLDMDLDMHLEMHLDMDLDMDLDLDLVWEHGCPLPRQRCLERVNTPNRPRNPGQGFLWPSKGLNLGRGCLIRDGTSKSCAITTKCARA